MDVFEEVREPEQNDPVLPRLNPFTFPSDTDMRFVVLIVSIMASSLFIYNLLSNVALFNIFKQSGLCALNNPTFRAALHTKDTHTLEEANLIIWKCQTPYLKPHILYIVSGVILTLVTAIVIYWFTPLLIILRKRLVPLCTQEVPEIEEYLLSLFDEIKLNTGTRFMISSLNFTSGAQAFGHLGRYYIALTGGLITLFSTDRTAFRAIILHELAHLKNKDVDKTYFAIAIWWAFVAVAIIPLIIVYSQHLLFTYPSLIVHIILLTLLVYLNRNAILRVREFYADVRASTWEHSQEALNNVIQSLPRPGQIWQSVFSTHPDPEQRSQTLRDTQSLFCVNLWTVLSLGIATGVALPNIQSLLRDFFYVFFPSGIELTCWYPGMTTATGTALIIVPLLVGVVGQNIWQVALSNLFRNEPYKRVTVLPFMLVGGMILGAFLAPSAENFVRESGDIVHTGDAIIQQLLWSLPWHLLLLVSLSLFFKWFAIEAQSWLSVAFRRKSPRLIYNVSLISTGIVLTIWLTQIFVFRSLNSAGDFGMSLSLVSQLRIIITDIVLEPTSLLAFAMVWAFPLAARLWLQQSPVVGQPHWAFLEAYPGLHFASVPLLSALKRQFVKPGAIDSRFDEASTNNSSALIQATDDIQSFLRLKQLKWRSTHLPFILRAALIGTLIFSGLFIVTRIWILTNVPVRISSTDHFKELLYFSMLGSGVLLQIGIASVVTAETCKLNWLCGLFTAFISGILMTISFLSLNLCFGGSIDFEFFWTTLLILVNGGALASIPAVLLVSAIAGRVRERSIFG